MVRSFNLQIPDFSSVTISYDETIVDDNQNLILSIKINDNKTFVNSIFSKCLSLNPGSCEFSKEELNLKLNLNQKIKKDLEYLFMDDDQLATYTNTITPIQYKVKIIQGLILFDN